MSHLRAIHSGEDLLRLEPPRASQGQLQLTNRLEMVRVDQDVLGVVEHLKRIDTGLVLMYDKAQEIYVLFWEGYREKDGQQQWCEDLVGAYRELDQRLINLIEKIDRQGRSRYDLEKELDRIDDEARRARDRAFSDKIGEHAERLRHALRSDLGVTSQAFMSGAPRGRGAKKRKGRR